VRSLRTALLVALVLLAVPRSARADDAWTGEDKTLHYAVSATLAGGSYVASAAALRARGHALLLAGGLTLAVGAGKELLDLAGLGQPSWKDLTWDVLGNVSGLALAWSIDLLVRGVSTEHPLLVMPAPVRSGASMTLAFTF